jgi:hypothetical protein
LKERPRALSREELIAAIWPDVLVTESNLTSLVNDVRDAIGDDARHPAFLRTHHGFGYSFAADVVTERAPTPGRAGVRLWLVWGLNVLHLSEGENILGRDPDVGIWLGDPSVSRRHARILVKGEVAELEDLGSKNGTYVGVDRVERPIPLHAGDGFRVGTVALVFQAASSAASTRTAP